MIKHPLPPLRALLLLAWPLLLLATSLDAGLYAVRTEPGSGLNIRIESIYDELPLHGYFPFRVSIQNDSSRDRSFSYDLAYMGGYRHDRNQQNSTTRGKLNVPAGTELNTTLYAQIIYEGRSSYAYLNIHCSISGPGIRDGVFIWSENSQYSVHSNIYVGLSKSLHTTHWGAVGARLTSNNKGNDIPGTSLAPALMPEDWQGYVAFDHIWLTVEDLQKLAPRQTDALIDWVAMGGMLNLVAPTAAGTYPALARLPVQPTPDAIARHGFGGIRTTADTDTLPNAIIKTYQQITINSAQTLGNIGHIHALDQKIPERELGTILLSVLFIGYVIVIGPVNLLVFARGNKRYRLFITTPIIALATSALLLLYIFLKDGVGADGARYRIIFLDPGVKKSYVLQYQATQTNLLLGRTFEKTHPAYIAPFEDNALHTASTHYNSNDGKYSGSWFASRARQHYHLRTILPTRSRIEQTATPGEFLSSIDAPLRAIYIVHPEQGVLKAENITTGQKFVPTSANANELNAWLKSNTAEFGAHFRGLLDNADARQGYFFASAPDMDIAELETLPAIQWRHTGNFIIGKIDNL